MFTGNNPETCSGLVVHSTNIYILLETMSSTYTTSGSYDAVILKIDLTGMPLTGSVVSLKSTLTLATGLYMLSDGSLIFGGATRQVFSQNFHYNAFFLDRLNIATGAKTCIPLGNVPDPKALSYQND